MKQNKQHIKLATLLIIFCALCIPALKLLAYPNLGEKQQKELTKLQSTELAEYTNQFELFFNESYGYRKEILKLANQFKYNFIHSSHTKKVIIGSNGYLFYNKPELQRDYRGAYQINNSIFQRLNDRLNQINHNLSTQNITFAFTIAPNKHTVYPEYLPDRIKKTVKKTRLQQLDSYFLSIKSNLYIPLSAKLIAQKEKKIYHKKDTHWNIKGAKIAYSTILKHFNIETKKEIANKTKITSGDLARMLGMEDELKEEISYMPITRSDYKSELSKESYFNPEAPIKKTVLLYSDSFGMYLRDLLIPNIETVIVINNYKFNEKKIMQFKPDFVVYELVERNINRLYDDLYLKN